MASVLSPLSSQPTRDSVSLLQQTLSAKVGTDALGRDRLQPVIIDLSVTTNSNTAASSDRASDTLDYSKLEEVVRREVEGHGNCEETSPIPGWTDLFCLAENIAVSTQLFIQAAGEVQERGRIEIVIVLPKALALAEGGVGVACVTEQVEKHQEIELDVLRLFVKGIKMPCIIGVSPQERIDRQFLIVDLVFWDMSSTEDESVLCRTYAPLVNGIYDGVTNSSYHTLEALATFIAKIAFSSPGFDALTVSIQKPSGITSAAGARIEITRKRATFKE
ncbi:tetrahydrobiopterin biosynthesis enzymes-like protein [Rhizodiscina lignyota]|uniref:dihydroneopterin aldolase n=1 Tax=Rhizodiscina lignyota TaxID=1504668 RepID=A0A9P4IS33_9PEZI|nr:tetrahydrobiopterin biosynthesis enzymes-like protein [Rhizodiscina lignyota]